ncbi:MULTISPECIES: cysteine hydrolase family protein [unclassified Rhizobium]|uniref:cysteine hydrolase family protein n=1 Tax=unclassified Rhizobium TaxID=2613769 RepID=UPI001AD995EF|nr:MULTISPECIES: isochorismatase family protein [unclassified Rhizobium]MBO9097065.1 isochorismatase family protein [Rhizobium sp. L58/93]MBO9134083.1 isochorismatase family protein [Rhizobium sp. B209b/85]MBO9167303.1 isochorismatase family protein [Rhizobium sp. L245/93]MBO9183262.1 isochorismatase family protein [Rhizobium sp. E27B/91]QXZ83605.1 isochorismatase family protein [Rhizobium sp. K1/93]
MDRTLLVIDIQNDYFSGGALPLWQADETESNILSAIAKARAAGDKVVLVQHISAASAGLFAKDGAGAAIRDNVLKAADNAPVVIKSSADAFQDTDLAGHLDGTDELLICGMMTQNCVVFTAMSRAADGMVVKVIGDLCTAPTETVHRIALNALGSKLPVLVAADVWK